MKKFMLYLGVSLMVVACNKEKRECPGATEKSFDLSGFHRINIGDANTVTITKGTDFSIRAKGCADDLADLDLKVTANQGALDIKFKNHRDNRYRVDFIITMPLLTNLHLSGAAKGDVSGFQGQNTVIRTILSGASECRLDGLGVNLSVEISGASKLTAVGNTENLYGSISGASSLDAYGATADEVDIMVSGSSKAWVKPVSSFFADASGDSRIYYKGNPTVKHLETSGNGRIIQE